MAPYGGGHGGCSGHGGFGGHGGHSGHHSSSSSHHSSSSHNCYSAGGGATIPSTRSANASKPINQLLPPTKPPQKKPSTPEKKSSEQSKEEPSTKKTSTPEQQPKPPVTNEVTDNPVPDWAPAVETFACIQCLKVIQMNETKKKFRNGDGRPFREWFSLFCPDCDQLLWTGAKL